MDFKQTQQAYARLKDQLEQGRITAEEFEARINEMVVTDSTGVLWQIGVSSGKWYRYDGQTWVEDVPREILSDGQSYPGQPVFVPAPVFPPTQASPQYAEQPKRRNWISGGLIAGALGLCCLIMAVGGWLIWNVPQRYVFVDGRLYPFVANDALGSYRDAIHLLPRWRSVITRWNVSQALLRPERPLVEALREEGWTVRSAGEGYVLLERPR